MKKKTYARLSLLIPFVLWGLCLAYALITDSIAVKQPDSILSTPVVNGISTIITFYVFGIMLWLLPYLLLSGILFVLTFRKPVDSLLYLFLLSPFAMAILMMVETAVLSLLLPGLPQGSSDAVSAFIDSMSLYIFFGGMSLLWGYLCVGIGFGIYKLLGSSGALWEEPILQLNPTSSSGS